MFRKSLNIKTPGRKTINITGNVEHIISESKKDIGLCHIFVPHTSASLILCENYDPDVRRDLEEFTSVWVPDGNPMFSHSMEGPDDMPAHIRTVYTHNDLTIPIQDNRLRLGTWQGVFLWEHRTHSHNREIIITVY